MGVTNIASNSTGAVPLSQRISGPPLYILSFAVALEVLFWAFDIQVQLVEVWIVALVVPLALSLAKPAADVSSKRHIKKMVDDHDGRPQDLRKRTPQVVAGRKPATERTPATQSPADTERTAQKAKIDSAVKEGNIAEAEAVLTELMEANNADAVSYNMLISASAKAGKSDRAKYWMEQMLS